MTWATVAETALITGMSTSGSATAADVAMASEVITIYANVTESASAAIGARDLEWLRKATAWQAVWQKQQPGYATDRSVVASIMADGVREDFAGFSVGGTGGEWKIMLAPLAARALKNLSWKGSRTLRTDRVEVPLGQNQVTGFLRDSGDALSSWTG